MQEALFESDQDAPAKIVSPLAELGAYEALWLENTASFKRLAQLFRLNPDARPSDLVPKELAEATARQVVGTLVAKGVSSFGVRVHRSGEYPNKLRDAQNPVELLYFRGWWGLVERKSVAVVGTRKPSVEGKKRTRRLVRELVRDGWTIVSGLAAGIDSEAHRTALAEESKTIAVIGTPISEAYPRENRELQNELATEHLIISQVPVLRYHRQTWRENRLFFPERNATMSALTEATIIVEAGNTSGTLVQARAALHQGRRLLILDSCFQNPDLSWPARFEKLGAIRIRDTSEIGSVLGLANEDRS